MSRRAGQIIKRGEGRYLVRIFLGRDGAGKRQYFNKTIRGTKKDAEKYLTKALRRLDLGEDIEPPATLFSDFLNDWLTGSVRPRIRERSFKTYKYLVDHYIAPALAKKRIVSITAEDIQALYADLRERKLSSRTQVFIHVLLTNAFRQAMRWDLLRVNPMTKVDAPRLERKEMSALTAAQARSLLDAVRDDRYAAILSLAFATGARPGEYLGLKWSDVNWKAGMLTIQRSLVWRGRDDWYLTPTKTKKSNRTLPLKAEMMKLLARHRKRQQEERLRAGADWQNHDFVFTRPTGLPIHHNTLRQVFKAALRRAGLPQTIRLYDARHSAATLMLAGGFNPKVVSERLGHSSIAVTLDTYTHILPGMQEEASEHLENVLFGQVGAQQAHSGPDSGRA
jgi:integrase